MVAKNDSFHTVECKALIDAILNTREFDEIERRVDDASYSDRERRIKGWRYSAKQLTKFLAQ